MPRPVFFSSSAALRLNAVNVDPNYLSIDVPRPAYAPGMGLIVFLAWRDGVAIPGAVVDPAGWTLRVTQQPGPSSNRILDRIAAAGEPASYTWSWAAGQEQVWAVILVYHSVNAALFTSAAYAGAIAASGQAAPGASQLRIGVGMDIDFPLPADWARAAGWTAVYTERHAATINGWAMGLNLQDMLLAGDRTIASAGTAWYTAMWSTDTVRELGALIEGGSSGAPASGSHLLKSSGMGFLVHGRRVRRGPTPQR